MFVEPSSALASRILRAHDNPSPPPESPILHQKVPSTHPAEGFLVDVSDTGAGDDEDNSRMSPFIAPVLALANMLASPFGPVFTPPRVSPRPPEPKEGVSEHNLIDFDMSATLPPRMSALDIQPNISADTQCDKDATSILDLLTSSSPKRAKSIAQSHTITISAGSSGSSADSEAQVLQELRTNRRPRTSQTPSVKEPSVRFPVHTDEGTAPDARLRRSSRSRRTPSPIRPLTALFDVVSHDLNRSPPKSPHRPHRPRRSRSSSKSPQRARRSRSPSKSPEHSHRSPRSPTKSRNISPRRSRSPVEEKNEQIDRLLTPFTEPEFRSRTSASLSPAPRKFNAVDPSEEAASLKGAELFNHPSTPRRKSPTSPGASAFASSQPDADSSTNAHFSVSRTPARRVPLSVAIDQGTVPQQESLLRLKRAPGTPLGSPAFKRLALDDPARSPAKRIPFSEAAPVTLGSTLKGKHISRKGQYLRAMSEDQDHGLPESRLKTLTTRRSASEEPGPSPLIPPSRLARSRLHPSTNSRANESGLPVIKQNKPRTALPFPIVSQSTRLPQSILEEDESDGQLRPAESVRRASPSRPSPRAKSSLREPSASVKSRIPRVGAKPYSRPKVTAATRDAKPPSSTTALNNQVSLICANRLAI